MQAIQDKLPYRIVEKWRNKAAEHMATTNKIPGLHQLCKFLEEEIKLATNPLRSKKWTRNPKRTHESTYQSTHSRATTTVRDTTKSCVFRLLDNHKTADCEHLLRDPTKLKQTILENKLCYKCLLPGHISKPCNEDVHCNINECRGYHSTVNHKTLNNKDKQTNATNDKGQQTDQNKKPRPSPRYLT